jgi:nucleoside-diphosphate-sugar epimerase
MKKDHCVVTGSSGFVGKHLCEYLIAFGAEVTGIDVRPNIGITGSPSNFVQGNLATGEGLDQVDWSRVNAVFHLAAAGVKASTRDWPICIRVNLMGTLTLLECLDKATHPPTLIYTHTFYEDFITSNPAIAESPYVLSKRATTQAVRLFARHYAGAIVTAKLFQIYGPGDAKGNLLPYTLDCLRGGTPALLGSGTGLRDWLYIHDLVTGLAACRKAAITEHCCGFELGSGQLTAIRDVLLQAAALLGRPASLLEFDPIRDRGDAELAGKAEQWPAAWRPTVNLEQGLRALIESF